MLIVPNGQHDAINPRQITTIMPSLYIVATPIGNLEDITLRAIRILTEVAIIATEDTRRTRKLLARYKIKTPLTSYHEHNKRRKIPVILETLKTQDMALVSDAGTPVISDPGYDLIIKAQTVGVSIISVPGPSAVISALSVSGQPPEPFLFVGFLPSRKVARRSLLETLKMKTYTLIAFEAPHRLHECLSDLLKILGDRDISLCRELTKIHEQIFKGKISSALDHFSKPKGEFTLVISGASEQRITPNLEELKAEIIRLKREGETARNTVSLLAEAWGLSRREVYQMWVGLNQ